MSQRDLRKQIITVMKKPGGEKIIVNMILNNIDMVMLSYWNVLGDMGISPDQFAKMKRTVKKRL